jgi:glycosyltransferase involved in cell wall biosynthesis
MTVVGQMERKAPPYLGSIVAGHKYHTIGLGVRPIPAEQFPVVYKSAQILLDLTTVGQSPASVLEAMAIGLPVVTMNPNIFDNIIVNGTTGFACYNEGDAKEAIDRLMNDAELSERIARQAKQVVLGRHSTVIQWKKAMVDASSISTGLWRSRNPAEISIAISSSSRKKNRDSRRPLNILTIPTHERYETQIAKTGHNFFAISSPGLKRWNTTFGSVPPNYRLLSGDSIEEQLSHCPTIDMVLCQHKQSHWQILSRVARICGCPLVISEYTTPPAGYPDQRIEQMRQIRGVLNIFNTEYGAARWRFDMADPGVRVVHHGIDTELFSSWTGGNKILTVVNDYIGRDTFCGFKVWQQVTQGLPVNPIGDTPGLSAPAKDVAELVEHYRSCGVFLNTSTESPIPTALLEAMSCGAPVVSTATCAIPTIIENGVNGFATNDPAMLRQYLVDILGDPMLAKRLGQAARETILAKCSERTFVEKCNKVFEEAVNA